MSSLRSDLADAAARRAAIVDGLSMGDDRARCMACRAKGLIAAVGVAAFGVWLAVAGGRR